MIGDAALHPSFYTTAMLEPGFFRYMANNENVNHHSNYGVYSDGLRISESHWFVQNLQMHFELLSGCAPSPFNNQQKKEKT